jgi:hypothetical protein
MASISERVLLPSSVTPIHYCLTLSPNLNLLNFSCEEEIKVNVSSSTKEVKMHSKEIAIQTASFSKGDISISLVKISYELEDNTVTLSFKDDLPLGEGNLKVSFTGILNSDMAGFYKSSYSDADGNKKVKKKSIKKFITSHIYPKNLISR